MVLCCMNKKCTIKKLCIILLLSGLQECTAETLCHLVHHLCISVHQHYYSPLFVLSSARLNTPIFRVKLTTHGSAAAVVKHVQLYSRTCRDRAQNVCLRHWRPVYTSIVYAWLAICCDCIVLRAMIMSTAAAVVICFTLLPATPIPVLNVSCVTNIKVAIVSRFIHRPPSNIGPLPLCTYLIYWFVIFEICNIHHTYLVTTTTLSALPDNHHLCLWIFTHLTAAAAAAVMYLLLLLLLSYRYISAAISRS